MASKQSIMLLASLGLNVIAKTPALLMLTYVLPLLKDAIGLANYALLLSSTSFGILFTIPFAGLNAAARRMMGTAHAINDDQQQSTIFLAVLLLAAAIAAVGSACATATLALLYSGANFPAFMPVALLPIICSAVGVLDVARSAYNEHFVTAGLQFAFQVLAFGIVIYVKPSISSPFEAALILQLPFFLSSCVTGLFLIRRRPYLLVGRPGLFAPILRGSLLASLADGIVTAALNYSVFFIGLRGTASESAWYGTFVRLFQTALAPVLLVLTPVASYLTLHWGVWSARIRLNVLKLGTLGVFVYAALAGAALSIGANRFISDFYDMAPATSAIYILPIAGFMLSIIAQKAYATLIYAIDHASFFSIATFFGMLPPMIVLILCQDLSAPMMEIVIFFIICIPIMLIPIVFDVWRRMKACLG